MLLADKLRKEKILTDSMLEEIRREISPCFITRTSDTPAVTQITDMKGLRTSHYMIDDLLDNTYKSLADQLPDPTVVPVGRVYTINYVSETYGTAPDARVVQAAIGKDYNIVAADIPALTDEGVIFNGWILNGVVVKEGDVIFNDVTLIASWTPSVEITYSTEVEGATGLPSDKTVAEGYALTAEDLPTPELEGYTFDGWFNGENEMTVGTVINEDTDIQARWTEII